MAKNLNKTKSARISDLCKEDKDQIGKLYKDLMKCQKENKRLRIKLEEEKEKNNSMGNS